MFLLMLAAMAVMYGSTENIFSSRTMNIKMSIAGGLKTPSSNPTEQTANKLQNMEVSTLDVIKTEPPQETIAAVGSGGTHTTSLEFPGMPNPCVEPRRKTVVEDLLCMVCIYIITVRRVNGVGQSENFGSTRETSRGCM